ncbi:MotE family protein [Salinarimonas rosea]|uniref:MotE family protein n=1 Tax=Salinarimonas rosea TaxID=552063 RepID=UPI0003FE188C|nr:hypothetical protein [Salinarimonas rosea]
MRIREALGRISQARMRLTDAVVIAAAALLLMKAAAFVAREPQPAAPPFGAGPSVVTPQPELPAFARVLAFARSETPPREVVTTGSNPEDAEPSGDGTAPAEGAPAAAAGNGGLSPDLLPDLRSPATSSEDMLRARMAEQRAELDRRLRELDMREELVAAAEARLEERVAGAPAGSPAPAAAAAAGATREAEDPANAEAMRRLVSMYEAMRPKDAARVFERLALEVLVPLAEDISPRRMAEVMAQMSPEAAERLTIALAMRARGSALAGARQPASTNALPPTELPAIALPPRP